MTAGPVDTGTSYDPELGPPPKGPERMPPIVYGLTVMAVIGGFLFGYDTGVVSGAMIVLKKKWQLSIFWQELVVAVTVGAAAVFSLLGGFFNDRFGRKWVIIVSSVLFVIGSVELAASSSKEVLLIGRIIVGIAIGLSSATIPAYVAETTPAHIRGRMITMFQLMITFGFWIAGLLDGAFSYINDDISWRLMLGVAAIPGFIQAIGFFFMPESPRWQVQKDKLFEAEKTLIRICGSKELAAYELKAIVKNHRTSDIERKQKGGDNVLLSMVKTPAMRRALITACLMQMFQQLCGINTVMYYSATIVEMGGMGNGRFAIWMAAVTSGVNFFCTFIGLYLVEKAGRRPLLLGSVVCVIVCLVILGIGFAVIAAQSPVSVTYTNGTDSRPELCQYRLCDSCSYNEDCGFCFVGNRENGTCVSKSENNTQWAAQGSCRALKKPEGGDDPMLVDPDAHWNYGHCPTSIGWLPIVGMVLYLCSFSSGFGSMPWTICAEIFPNWARSAGTAAGTAVNWTFNLIISLTFLSLANAISRQGAFFFYAGITAVGFVVMYFLIPETKDKQIEEVQKLFEKPWFGKKTDPMQPAYTVKYNIASSDSTMELVVKDM